MDWSGLKMICKDVVEALEKFAPSFLAERWDNVGLLAGRMDRPVEKIMLSLDPGSDVIREAMIWGADLLITHHPLIFSGMKSVTREDFIGRRVYDLIRNDICYYAMHTNFDTVAMAEAVADQLELSDKEVLEALNVESDKKEGIGRIGKLTKTMSLEEFAVFVKEKCNISGIRVFGDPAGNVETVALVPGSGKDYIAEAIKKGADVFLSGDIGHHHGLDAIEQGIAVIDAGHYGLEKIFASYIADLLGKEFPECEIKMAKEESPFWTVL